MYGYGSGWLKRRRGSKPRRRRKDVPETLFQRVSAEVKVMRTGKIYKARLMLNDLNFNSMSLFTSEPIEKGQRVAIVLEKPNHLFVKGDVIFNVLYTLNTKIISDEMFHYRIGIRFRFNSYQEQDALRKYCENIMNDVRPEDEEEVVRKIDDTPKKEKITLADPDDMFEREDTPNGHYRLKTKK